MRFILALLFVAAVVHARDLNARAIDAKKLCKQEFPITEENLKSMIADGVLPDESLVEDRCFVECMMKTLDSLVTDDGKFDPDSTKQHFLPNAAVFFKDEVPLPTSEQISTAVDKCATKFDDAEGLCMTNYKIWSCIVTTLKSN